ncbi:Adaptor protein complex beta subunit [Ascobolus immersus RN42]|uniref:AP complex subunit beta n=1 Tax=Ascobolus immersus RN42 TaxID=1160509 RepID=A0A3N4HZP7_ASCIM|nr:Adaptor protein complex beta subunit [Ascobolus immersus RN42]
MAANRIRSMFPAAPRKGETFELRNGLNSQFAHERKDAIRNTIAAMTLGKDVSVLFPDIIKNMATGDLDQKKLVYLYLMNYAKTHPELCILAVNTFLQDAEDPNPLIRALAIRTMGCIRVDKIVDYLEEPLRKTLKDESPYVRKTAAICVAKFFAVNTAKCLENGFLESLQEMIGDSNPMVVANSVTALAEIQNMAPETKALVVTSATLKKLLMALNECTEWGRITILSTLADYRTTDVKESEHICERVVPQFQHVNPAVVIAAVKAVFLHMRNIGPELSKTYLKKMAPPLVTLVSSAPEVQYVALRNINLLLQKQPDILNKELRVFFCKYDDPPYVKIEKLDIMIRIGNERNIDQLLMELKEYALDVDMDFVRRAVRAIGQVAVKIESASERCINVLLDLLNTKVNYVVQEAVVVIKDIFRKYQGYEGIIPTLCGCIDELDEPNARGSLIWIVGEYAEKITNADEILGTFIEGFKEEATQVQLQLLTATVKLFLKKPDTNQTVIQNMLKTATSESDNPDIRDRAYIYWRLLSAGPDIARRIVLSDKPAITTTIHSLPPNLLDELITEISTLASVYHKPPETFVGGGRFGADTVQRRAIEEFQQIAKENPVAVGTGKPANDENLLDIDFSDSPAPSSSPAPAASSASADLFGVLESNPSPSPPPPANTGSSNMDDLFSILGSTTTSPPPQQPSALNTSGGGLVSGLEGLQLGGLSSTPAPQTPVQPKDRKQQNEDILGLF